jgi:basic amino acid/polyamine antiporter, APA family
MLELTCGDGQPCQGIINLPAMFLTLSLTFVLCMGVKKTSNMNAFFVGIKLVVILLFVFVGIAYINPQNYSPFIPESQG